MDDGRSGKLPQPHSKKRPLRGCAGLCVLVCAHALVRACVRACACACMPARACLRAHPCVHVCVRGLLASVRDRLEKERDERKKATVHKHACAHPWPGSPSFHLFIDWFFD